MRALRLICLIGSAVLVPALTNAQVVRCQDGVFREASNCSGARQSAAVTNRETRTAPSPVAVPEPNRGEKAGQYSGRMEVYCVSQPPTQRAECRVQAQARVKLSSANDLAALLPESHRRLGDTPLQYMARWEVYCVSLPPAQRAECREQANAQSRLYSANYEAVAIPLQTREALKAMTPPLKTREALKIKEGKPSPLQPNDCNPRVRQCN